MKNSAMLFLILILLFVGGYVVFSNSQKSYVNSGISGSNGNVQVVNFHVEGSSYVFEPTTVKKGIPVRLVGDISRMPGCSKSVVSRELGIRKVFGPTSNTVEFTPQNTGEFYIACSMNMYRGTLKVE